MTSDGYSCVMSWLPTDTQLLVGFSLEIVRSVLYKLLVLGEPMKGTDDVVEAQP